MRQQTTTSLSVATQAAVPRQHVAGRRASAPASTGDRWAASSVAAGATAAANATAAAAAVESSMPSDAACRRSSHAVAGFESELPSLRRDAGALADAPPATLRFTTASGSFSDTTASARAAAVAQRLVNDAQRLGSFVAPRPAPANDASLQPQAESATDGPAAAAARSGIVTAHVRAKVRAPPLSSPFELHGLEASLSSGHAQRPGASDGPAVRAGSGRPPQAVGAARLSV